MLLVLFLTRGMTVFLVESFLSQSVNGATFLRETIPGMQCNNLRKSSVNKMREIKLLINKLMIQEERW